MVGVAVDVTERRDAEVALRRSDEVLRFAHRMARLGAWRLDLSTWRVAMTPEACEIIGIEDPGARELDEALDFALEADRARFREALETIVASEGECEESARIRRRSDGRELQIRLIARFERDADGRSGAVVGTLQDVTELLELEEQLRQSQKMEAIGRLAGGVAHDFNNLLVAILGHGDLLMRALEREAKLAGHVEQILRAARRAANLTRQQLALGRRQALRPRPIDVNRILAGMEDLLRRLIGEDIDLTLSLVPGEAVVEADRGQLEQVVLNQVTNARDAMPDGGRLLLATDRGVVGAEEGSGFEDLAPGAHVVLRVEDSGTGMDRETMSRVFEPFFTTKDVGKGTGLGLSTVYGILKQSRGDVRVHSEPGRGTTFEVFLPEVAAPAEDEAPAAPAPARGGSERILLVEDEEAVAAVLAETLHKAGYELLLAGDGDTAIDLARQASGRIDVVISDVVMPGMSGRELAGRLERMIPGIRVLFMSGYIDSAPPPGVFLQKPFLPAQLLRRVRRLLDGDGEGREVG